MSETFVWQLVDLYTQKVINVFRPRLVIGRSKEADILCTAISASRSHAEFTLTEDGCLAISDLKSLNGTYVNRQKIPVDTRQILQDCDEVGIGIDIPAEESNIFFRVQKMTSVDVITLDDSDDDDISGNVELVENNIRENSCDLQNQQGGSITPNQKKLEENKTLPSTKECSLITPSEEKIEENKILPSINECRKNSCDPQSKLKSSITPNENELQVNKALSSTSECSSITPNEKKVVENKILPSINECRKNSCDHQNKLENLIALNERKVEENEILPPINEHRENSYDIQKKLESSIPPNEKNVEDNNILPSVSDCNVDNKQFLIKIEIENENIVSNDDLINKDTSCTNIKMEPHCIEEDLIVINDDDEIENENIVSNNDLTNKDTSYTHIKMEPHCIDEELIVINDDDDEMNVLSQVLSAPVPDDIFIKIKKEVEEFDRIDNQDWEYPVALGSDEEDLCDIFADELNENKNSGIQYNIPTSLIPQTGDEDEDDADGGTNEAGADETDTDEADVEEADSDEDTHTLLNNNLSELVASSLSVLPSVSNGSLVSSETFYKKSCTLLIEAQPLKRHSRKRKSHITNPEEYAKKQKGNANGIVNLQEHSKRKRKAEPTGVDNKVSKKTKKKIAEIRKEKLKELAAKPTGDKSTSNKSGQTKPKVKVSEGRGIFLLDIEPVPSTSKAKDPGAAKVTVHSALKKKLLGQTSTVRAESSGHNNRYVDINISKEVEEIISWNTSWLTKNEHLTHLNPIVRIKKLKPLEDNYSSYHDYFEINRSLLMVEQWAHIQKEFEVNRGNCVFPLYIEDCDCGNNANVWILSCLTYLSKIQAESVPPVKDFDLIVMDLRLVENQQILLKPSFGYVQDTSRCILRNHHYINRSLAEKLGTAPHTKISFKVLINKCPKKLKIKSIVNFKILTSLVSHLRLFKAIKYLEHSALINFILKPKVKDFKMPDVVLESLILEDSINRHQLQAVMEAVCVCSRPEPGLYLIQGPPGTGKTNVIKNVVLQLLYGKHRIRNRCILLVAPSNAAVDQLVLKLVEEARPKLTDEQKREMKLLRVGPTPAIHVNARPYCLEFQVKKNLKKDLFAESTEALERNKLLLKEIDRLEAEMQILKAQNKDVAQLKCKLEALKIKNDNFAREILHDKYNKAYSEQCDKLLSGAKIICTTLSSCITKRIEDNVKSGKLSFACCIVDEATQSTEQETLIPLTLGIKRMVLVGDPQQLPATVVSPDARRLGYGCSLFQRIVNNFKNVKIKPLKFLNIQFRMHPQICMYPNEEYYGGKLESGSFKYHKPLQNLKPFLMFSLNVLNSSHQKELYKNGDEANFIQMLIEIIIEKIPKTTAVCIGIITPYQNQRSVIHTLLKNITFRDNISIECNTVDGFQGRETDIIILSCVREAANTFLNDAHRLNVALTRAKYALYIVGTKTLFDSCDALVKLKHNAEKRKLFKDGTSLKSDQLKKIVWIKEK